MKKLGLFAVLLGVALFVGCAQQAEKPAATPPAEEGPAATAPADGGAAAEGEKKAEEKAEGEKPAEKTE
jgi:hypothetical protein